MEERIREGWREQTNTSFSEPSIAGILGGLDTSEYQEKLQMTGSRRGRKKSSHFILLCFLINRSSIPMESSAGEKGEVDLIFFGLDFPDATFIKVDALSRPTYRTLCKVQD